MHYQIPPNGAIVTLNDQRGLPYQKLVQEAGGIEKARDLFCFCAFTSLRFSDMYNLRRSDIDDQFIHVVTLKTHDTLPINLNTYSRAILDKYKDCKFKLVGTHAARRSFICYALSIGIPPVMVMQWTGHSDYQSMKPYIDIASADKSKAMDLFDKGLEDKNPYF